MYRGFGGGLSLSSKNSLRPIKGGERIRIVCPLGFEILCFTNEDNKFTHLCSRKACGKKGRESISGKEGGIILFLAFIRTAIF
jgi:hypothetical protein